MARMSMLIDLTRCIGCDACTLACKQENGTPVDTFFARVLNVEAGTYPNVKRVYIPVLCNHCDDAPCLKSCPNKAIIRREDGIVLIDQDRCRGTGACVSACPYGNIYLRTSESWYLNEDEPYERDHVKPRLNENVARKCTYCAHRVDEGLDPACVVACPTTARIFGDLDDPNSRISTYIEEQKTETNREPFHLLPEAGTKPAGCYLGTMSSQQSVTLGSRAGTEGSIPLNATSPFPESPAQNQQTHAVEPKRGFLHKGLKALRVIGTVLLLASALQIHAEEIDTMQPKSLDAYLESTCTGCHGLTGMGGLGPPIAQTKLSPEEFLAIVREGKGMMPGTPAETLSDEQVSAIYSEMTEAEWEDDQIPIAFQVGQFLSTRNVAFIFLGVFLFATIFAVKVWLYWMGCSGVKQLRPHIGKFGWGRAAGIVLKSLVVDGLFVKSLWDKSKHRWFMHGLMLYGFIGLMLADVLMQIFNPSRGDLPLLHPLKALPIVSGIAVLAGISYVMYRYKTDEYIDNGLTLGRDFLFVNLLFHTIVSGFLTVWLNRAGVNDWMMTIYIYHLAAIGLLICTAPFTRFAHAWVVPSMVAVTRLTDAVTASGVDLGFEREPSPGRHHKSQRIAEQVIGIVDPDGSDKVVLRYYP